MPLGPVSFFILGSVVWFVCAYSCWQMAPRKHRNPVPWLIAGIFTGPLALAALVVMGPGKWQGRIPGKTKRVDERAKVAEVPSSQHHGSGHQQSHHHGSEGKK
jgi:hypothetical protein